MVELLNLDWQEVVKRLIKFATSELGRVELKRVDPLESPEKAIESFSVIEEFTTPIRTGIRPHAESLDLMSNWHQRLEKHAVLKTLELKDVRHFCIEIVALKETIKPIDTPRLQNLVSQLMNADEPLSAIDQIMTAQGDIRNDASEKLYRLHQEKTLLARQVHNTLNRLVKDYQIEHLLQDKFVTTREGRWVLPIRSGMQHGFQGIVHDASQSKQTVFMEPQEVVPLNNRLREIEVEIEQEIEHLLMELSQYLHTLHLQFKLSRDALLFADVQFAKAQLTVALGAQRCEFTEQAIYLREVFHPLLTVSKNDLVTNTVEMDVTRRILLLSGPNAGGKTVLLKAVGLAAQMARCGLPICAHPNSKIPFFKNIVVAIGDSQSVDANLSTFAAHLKKLEEATLCNGLNQLILIDEICGSTDPEEGAALARSFLTYYNKNNVFGIITSHLSNLKSGWGPDTNIINGSMEFSPQSGPTYKFILGVPGQSLAIQTAKRVGIRSEIINLALENLSPESRKNQEEMSQIEELKVSLGKLQSKLQQEIKQSEGLKNKYEKLIKEFESTKEGILDREIQKASQKINDLITEANVKEVFLRHENLEKIKHDMPAIVKGQSSSSRNASKSMEISSAGDFAQYYPPGTHVYINSLGRDGIIQSQPNNKGELSVLSNSMRLMISWRDLKPPLQAQKPTQAVLRNKGFASHSALDNDRTVDLRGLNIDEASSQLEIQLDTASLANEDRVKVIHGHGTDTLKKSIRSYLSRSVYVKTWLAGNKETGGDGITWIELK